MRARGLMAALLLAAAALSTLPAGPDGPGAVARPRQQVLPRTADSVSTHLHLRGGAADDESKGNALSIGDAAKKEVAALLRDKGVRARERGS